MQAAINQATQPGIGEEPHRINPHGDFMCGERAICIALLDKTAHAHAGQAAAPGFRVMAEAGQNDFFFTAEEALQPLLRLCGLKQAHISIRRQAGMPISQIIAVISAGHTHTRWGRDIHRAGQDWRRHVSYFAQWPIWIFQIG